MFARVAIFAPGLLGASLAMALRKRRLADSISIWARRSGIRTRLRQQDWCDLAPESIADACEGAQLIVLCAPVERIIQLARDLSPIVGDNSIVTDVGSVKSKIVRECDGLLRGRARFIGSHPMAGSEKTGMANADADLFQGRACFVTSTDKSDPDATATVRSLWQALGSEVVVVSPEQHDEIVAQVSHLPHFIAATLAAYLKKMRPQASLACGNGLRDTTRIAAGDPALWSEIANQNRHEILRAIDGFQDELRALRCSIANADETGLSKRLAEGKTFRDLLDA